MPDAFILGGPNGAGKSTFAAEYLRDEEHLHLSADHIAAELNPEHPAKVRIQAGKEFLRRFDRATEEGENIVLESTLAGKGLYRMLEQLRNTGYTIRIVFIFLDSPRTCLQRVKERVRRGGHRVPDEDVIRRFYRSVSNFWRKYRRAADRWYLFSNSGDQFEEVAVGEGNRYNVIEEALFTSFRHILSETDE